jgi:hypothetical protein
LACEPEAKDSCISSTYGVSDYRFDCFHAAVDGTPTFDGAIVLCEKFLYFLYGNNSSDLNHSGSLCFSLVHSRLHATLSHNDLRLGILHFFCASLPTIHVSSCLNSLFQSANVVDEWLRKSNFITKSII